MKRVIGMFVVATAFFLAAPAAVIAQSEKISIRIAPRPGQTVRMTSTQEADIDISIDGAAAAPGVMAMKMAMRMVAAMTQKTGAVKPDGTLDAEITYDQFRIEMSINGQAMPADFNNPLTGKTVVFTYNQMGDIVRVQGMPDGLPEDMFRQLMGSMFGNLPAAALAVGETTTAPMDFTLPLPVPGAAAMKLTGETRLTLVSVDKDARGRSATFTSTTAGGIVSDSGSPGGQGKTAFDLDLRGEGTYVINLDTGMLRSNNVTSSVNGKMKAAGAASPGMTMRGTVTLSMTSD